MKNIKSQTWAKPPEKIMSCLTKVIKLEKHTKNLITEKEVMKNIKSQNWAKLPEKSMKNQNQAKLPENNMKCLIKVMKLEIHTKNLITEKEVMKNMKNQNQAKLPEKKYERNALLNRYETDTGFNVICCSCNEYKSKESCTNILKRKTNESKFTTEQEAEYLNQDVNCPGVGYCARPLG